jgi:NAD(P)-dependent dehydrogenase (short-subunit alcohol dehydrogenase family)
MTLDLWQNTINTNLTAAFLVSREYLKQLESATDELKARAAVVFVGSTAGKYTRRSMDYAASKSGTLSSPKFALVLSPDVCIALPSTDAQDRTKRSG